MYEINKNARFIKTGVFVYYLCERGRSYLFGSPSCFLYFDIIFVMIIKQMLPMRLDKNPMKSLVIELRLLMIPTMATTQLQNTT